MHLQYQPWKQGPWFGFNWRYDSGLVAGNAPCYGGPQFNSPQSDCRAVQPRRSADSRQCFCGMCSEIL